MIVGNRGLVGLGFMSFGEGKARNGCSNVFTNLYFLRLLFSFFFITSCIIGMLAFLAFCHWCFFISHFIDSHCWLCLDQRHEQERRYGYLLFSLEYNVVLSSGSEPAPSSLNILVQPRLPRAHIPRALDLSLNITIKHDGGADMHAG